MQYTTGIVSLMNWFATNTKHESEFMCAVCGKIFNRDIAGEFENLTFNPGSMSIATGPGNELQVGLIWTCSKMCKITYILQKA